MIAAEIAHKVGIKKENIFKAIKNFKGLEHRRILNHLIA